MRWVMGLLLSAGIAGCGADGEPIRPAALETPSADVDFARSYDISFEKTGILL